MVGSLADVSAHPGTFGLAGAGITVGRNAWFGSVQSLQTAVHVYRGTIARVTLDVSGRPYEDVEKELALAFSRDRAAGRDG